MKSEVAVQPSAGKGSRRFRWGKIGLESLREYLLLEQDRAELRVIRRSGNGWTEHAYGSDDVVHLTSLDLEIAMQHLYEGVWR